MGKTTDYQVTMRIEYSTEDEFSAPTTDELWQSITASTRRGMLTPDLSGEVEYEIDNYSLRVNHITSQSVDDLLTGIARLNLGIRTLEDRGRFSGHELLILVTLEGLCQLPSTGARGRRHDLGKFIA